jgi:ABC-type nickel/cobalt efflux system permease component RcnA
VTKSSTVPTTPLALLGLGFLLGVRHALDLDHLAAVSTIVGERRGLRGSSLVGALWGLGHTAALLVVAALVVAFRTEIPPAVAHGLELAVALMLIGLGVNLLRTLWMGGRIHVHVHDHDGRRHAHPHVHGAAEAHEGAGHHAPWRRRRPFLVGLVHGLAGSVGLMLAVLATISTPALALAYVVAFGCGSIGGMAAMSALMGLPLAVAAERFSRAEVALRACAAVASVVVGLGVAWRVGGEMGIFL